MRTPALGELVTLRGSNGFDVDGILFRGRGQTIVVHVHGSLGNFYHNSFVRHMAAAYQLSGVGFLAVNLSAHDGLAEGYRCGSDFEYVGGSVARWEDCVAEIEGAVAFATCHGERVVLQGHSLGCDRVVHYLLLKGGSHDVVLLSPCDSYQLQSEWLAPETVEGQIARLKQESATDPVLDWLPSREYGLRRGDGWTYHIPITRPALLSIMEGPPFSLFRLSRPMQYQVLSDALVYIGGADRLQAWPSEVMFEFLQPRVRRLTRLFDPDGDHMLAPNAIALAEGIARWVAARDL